MVSTNTSLCCCNSGFAFSLFFNYVHVIVIIIAFSEEVEGASPKDVMDILLLSQYFDTLSAVGANSLILEHDPAVVAKLQGQVGASFSSKNFSSKSK